MRIDEVIAGYFPGVNILSGCDLYAHSGELVRIIGPNGASKVRFAQIAVRPGQGAKR